MAEEREGEPLSEEFSFEDELSSVNVSFAERFIGDEGIEKLASNLRTNSVVTSLDLRGNHIRSEGAVALGDVLRANSTIKIITLEWNNLGILDSGMRALAAALEINVTLTHLDLRNNRIGPEGGASIARALRSNTGLRHLDLRWNDLGLAGGRALAQALLEANHTLHECLVSGNKIAAENLKQIEAALARNSRPNAISSVNESEVSAIRAQSEGRALRALLDTSGSSAVLTGVSSDAHSAYERIVQLETNLKDSEAEVGKHRALLMVEVRSREAAEQRALSAEQRNETLVAEVEAERSSYSHELDALREEIEALRVRLEKSQAETRQFKLDAAKREVALGKEISTLRSRLSSAEDGITEGSTRAARAEAALATRDAELSEARERAIEAERNFKQTLEGREAAHAEEVNTLKRTLEARLELTERQRIDAEAARAEAEHQSTAAKAELMAEKLSAERDLNQATIRLKQQGEERVKLVTGDIERQLEIVHAERDQFEKAEAALRAELENARKRAQQAEQDASGRIRIAHEAHEEALKAHRTTQLELDRTKGEHTAIVHRHETLQAKFEASEKSVASLKDLHAQELSDLMREHAEAEAGMDALKNGLAEAEASVAAKNAELRKAHARHDDALESLEGRLIAAVKQQVQGVRIERTRNNE